ncbi:hypothetical protein ACFS5L_22605 [Streptomyces phyllanthi]|uniref:hypothetical protein n=1 Tax=Streptomyces phyllanthi TaxID=1803180 RepID=UPI0018832FE7|nr:hypothetical protein [Streptomyces phyllanthi]
MFVLALYQGAERAHPADGVLPASGPPEGMVPAVLAAVGLRTPTSVRIALD